MRHFDWHAMAREVERDIGARLFAVGAVLAVGIEHGQRHALALAQQRQRVGDGADGGAAASQATSA